MDVFRGRYPAATAGSRSVPHPVPRLCLHPAASSYHRCLLLILSPHSTTT